MSRKNKRQYRKINWWYVVIAILVLMASVFILLGRVPFFQIRRNTENSGFEPAANPEEECGIDSESIRANQFGECIVDKMSSEFQARNRSSLIISFKPTYGCPLPAQLPYPDGLRHENTYKQESLLLPGSTWRIERILRRESAYLFMARQECSPTGKGPLTFQDAIDSLRNGTGSVAPDGISILLPGRDKSVSVKSMDPDGSGSCGPCDLYQTRYILDLGSFSDINAMRNGRERPFVNFKELGKARERFWASAGRYMPQCMDDGHSKQPERLRDICSVIVPQYENEHSFWEELMRITEDSAARAEERAAVRALEEYACLVQCLNKWGSRDRVWRGMDMSHEEMDRYFQKLGEVMPINALTSTTRDPAVACDYAADEASWFLNTGRCREISQECSSDARASSYQVK